jgi:hypothetical protein
MNHAFIDSCVFISYGTEFEDFHSSCITFFVINVQVKVLKENYHLN